MAKLVNKKDGRIAEIISKGTTTTKVNIDGVVKDLRNVTIKRFWEEVADNEETVEPEVIEEEVVEKVEEKPKTKKADKKETKSTKKAKEVEPEPVHEEEEDDSVDAVNADEVVAEAKAKKAADNKSKASKPAAKKDEPKKEVKTEAKKSSKKKDLPKAEVIVGDGLDEVIKQLCDYTVKKGGGTRQTNSYMGLLGKNGRVMIEVHKKTKSNTITIYVLRQALEELPYDFEKKYEKSVKPCKYSNAINVTEVGVDAVLPIIDECFEVAEEE